MSDESLTIHEGHPLHKWGMGTPRGAVLWGLYAAMQGAISGILLVLGLSIVARWAGVADVNAHLLWILSLALALRGGVHGAIMGRTARASLGLRREVLIGAFAFGTAGAFGGGFMDPGLPGVLKGLLAGLWGGALLGVLSDSIRSYAVEKGVEGKG